MKTLFALSVILMSAAAISPALAQRGFAQNGFAPGGFQGWCAVSDANEGGRTCGFATLYACNAYLRGLGGFCQPDPFPDYR